MVQQIGTVLRLAEKTRKAGETIMTPESSTVRCPSCGRRQRYMADEWPDDCVCGYKFCIELDETDYGNEQLSKESK
jgi:hypothetical protein